MKSLHLPRLVFCIGLLANLGAVPSHAEKYGDEDFRARQTLHRQEGTHAVEIRKFRFTEACSARLSSGIPFQPFERLHQSPKAVEFAPSRPRTDRAALSREFFKHPAPGASSNEGILRVYAAYDLLSLAWGTSQLTQLNEILNELIQIPSVDARILAAYSLTRCFYMSQDERLRILQEIERRLIVEPLFGRDSDERTRQAIQEARNAILRNEPAEWWYI